MPEEPDLPTINTTYVPADLDAADLALVEPLYTDLLLRTVTSAADLESWLVDRSELDAACSEAAALLYIAMTCNTDDQAAADAYTRFIETVPPRLKPIAFELDKRQAKLATDLGQTGGRFAVIHRDTAADVELFRPENVALETDLAKLDQKYDTISAAMTVEYQGAEKTLPQMGVYQESTDRAVREETWRLVAQRRLQDAEPIDAIFGEMVALRHRVAQNAGFGSFTAYAFKAKHRFDYTPEHCFAFHEACEKVVAPFIRRQDEIRRKKLGVEKLRPWDLTVDVRGREPLRPFEGGADLMRKSIAAFEALDPRLSSMLRTLGDGSGRVTAQNMKSPPLLDLDSRKGKAPGGYQYMRDRSRVPFIFMNAAGLHRDLETMVHEAGHAFHSMLCVDEPLLHYRHSPIEFAEVASMSMELLTMPHWAARGSFYEGQPEDHARAKRRQLESSVGLLPWIATIDAFQHWIYASPTHTRAERTAEWLRLDRRFGHAVSWDGLEPFLELAWQRQGHLFGSPFYYIEYGIAQLGALGLWIRSLEEGPTVAIDAYIRALSLGGSKPLPELFAAAGLPFDFGPRIVEKLVTRVESELAKLPE